MGEQMNIFEIKDHNSLKKFYEQNCLEVSDDLKSDDGAIFSIGTNIDGTVVAAATLSLRKENFILDYVAVAPQHRKMGLGGEILETIIKKAVSLGAKNIYITARRPEFFRKHGFINGSPENLDMNEGCVGCPQYNTTCVSVPMVLNLGENYDQN